MRLADDCAPGIAEGRITVKIAVDDPIREAETLLGQAALRIWGELPRDGQELLFESAVGEDYHMRKLLAVFLHDRHPRTYHPPKPILSQPAS
jgi:hypothetical protein